LTRGRNNGIQWRKAVVMPGVWINNGSERLGTHLHAMQLGNRHRIFIGGRGLMKPQSFDSKQEATRMCSELRFCCQNNHSITVYSSDPYYPDWVECPECGKLMATELCKEGEDE